MKTIEQFCDKHNACAEGREWAIANRKDMAEVWDEAQPDWLIWVATRPGVLTDKELRLFAVFCARSVEHLLTDDRSRNSIDVAERFANGQATNEELASAREAAQDAARDAARAARDAARDAARAARDAAWDAAWEAAREAAREAAWAAWAAQVAARDAARAAQDAARDAARAARDAAWDAAWEAALQSQAVWLRTNTKPSFD